MHCKGLRTTKATRGLTRSPLGMSVIQNPSQSFIRTREGDRTIGHDSKEAREIPHALATAAKPLPVPEAHINSSPSLTEGRRKY